MFGLQQAAEVWKLTHLSENIQNSNPYSSHILWAKTGGPNTDVLILALWYLYVVFTIICWVILDSWADFVCNSSFFRNVWQIFFDFCGPYTVLLPYSMHGNFLVLITAPFQLIVFSHQSFSMFYKNTLISFWISVWFCLCSWFLVYRYSRQ